MIVKQSMGLFDDLRAKTEANLQYGVVAVNVIARGGSPEQADEIARHVAYGDPLPPEPAQQQLVGTPLAFAGGAPVTKKAPWAWILGGGAVLGVGLLLWKRR